MSCPDLPRARLRDLAVSAAVGRTTDPSVVALLAETLLDSLENIVASESVHDDAVDLPSFVETLKKERDNAVEEENDTIQDLRADVERLEKENEEQAEKIVELESTDAEIQIQALTRELTACREQHTRELDAAREETRELRRRVLAVVAEDGVFCRLSGCYNEAHSSDGRCTFHRGDDEAPKAAPSPEPKKRARRKAGT